MEKMGRFEIRLCFFLAFSLSFLSLIVSVSAASLPSPSLTVPASLQVGTKAIIPFTFSSNIFADVLSPQHPGLQFLLCKASETTPALCVQGARSDARNSLSRPAPFFEGSAARDKGSAGSFELDLMRVVPGTYNLYVFAVWWPTSSKGIVAGRYDTYKSPSFEVGALIETSRFLPSPSLTVPASLQVGTKAIIPFTFSSNIFADVLSPQHPGLQFLLCKASETTPALCVQGARSDARNSLSRPAPFFEGSAARDKGSAGSFELDLMRVVPGTYNLYVFAVWWPTSSKGIVAGRYDTYKSPSFEVGANPNASPFDFDGDGCIGDKDLYILDNDKCPTSEGGVKLTECKVAVNGEKNFQIVALAFGQAWGSSLQCSAH